MTREEELADALRPFAEALAEWGDEPLLADGNCPDALVGLVTLGDFRRAAKTLSEHSA